MIVHHRTKRRTPSRLEYDAEKKQNNHHNDQQRTNDCKSNSEAECKHFEEQRQQQQNADHQKNPYHFLHPIKIIFSVKRHLTGASPGTDA